MVPKLIKKYDSIFKKRTLIKRDGCGLFFKKSKFKLLKKFELEFNELSEDKLLQSGKDNGYGYLTNNVAQIALLESKENNKKLWVVNTHIFWDPSKAHIKLMQVSHIFKNLEVFITQNLDDDNVCNSANKTKIFEKIPIIFIGDFNSLPDSSVYSFIKNGILKTKEIPQCLHIMGSFSHDFNFRSAYESEKEPITNFTNDFVGCLDYIWYSSALELTETLKQVTEEDFHPYSALPNPILPSDHSSLAAKFLFK
eukprot:TRINITY_DN7004_c0_g1_i1.p1 TRINITY_DN7004_c0_g1~~TRINITY_DN7004_c0_g1_i1.p1  ORF type:complete len:253 (-),score=30.68 TRINITY_DN7004_c0_g1_i1:49-807(-)